MHSMVNSWRLLMWSNGDCCSDSPALPAAATHSAAAAPASTLLSPLPDNKTSQVASDIESSLSSLAAQLGGAVGSSENQQTNFLSAFVQLLQSQAVCLSVTDQLSSLTLQPCLWCCYSYDFYDQKCSFSLCWFCYLESSWWSDKVTKYY